MSTTYVALLRGINVGGHNVAMERLRALFGDLGLGDVRSYIQSGNVFFDADGDRPTLRAAIERHLQDSLGYPVPTCLRTVDELEDVMALDPFRDVTVTPDIRLAVNFLAEPVATSIPIPYRTPDGGYEVVGKTPSELFVVWRLQDGRPGKSYGVLERQVGVPTTTRFWHTTAKILAAAREPPRPRRRSTKRPSQEA